MQRTQIYLDENRATALSRRAAVEGRTKSELIRSAIDQFIGGRPKDNAERMAQFRRVLHEVAGSAPHLPAGEGYVRELRKADLEREIEARWRR
ncbi:MAG: CopG family transcriptional regulator [Gaiellaceae bacterium]